MCLCIWALVPCIGQRTTLRCHFSLSTLMWTGIQVTRPAFRSPCFCSRYHDLMNSLPGLSDQFDWLEIGVLLCSVFGPCAFQPGLNENFCCFTSFVPMWCCQFLEIFNRCVELLHLVSFPCWFTKYCAFLYAFFSFYWGKGLWFLFFSNEFSINSWVWRGFCILCKYDFESILSFSCFCQQLRSLFNLWGIAYLSSSCHGSCLWCCVQNSLPNRLSWEVCPSVSCTDGCRPLL